MRKTLMVVLPLMAVLAAQRVSALEVMVVAADDAPLGNAAVAVYNTGKPVPDNFDAVVDQRNREFVPLVSAVPVGTMVLFPNSDDIRHHVYSFSPARQFELKLYHGTTADPVRFGEPGKVVLGCNIHDSMIGYIYVFDTPVMAVTDATGRASFPGLQGEGLRVEVHHPWVDVSESRAGISAGQQIRVQMGELKGDPRKSEPQTELESLFN